MTTFVRLYLEELRALPRGRFALAGAAVLCALLAFLAGVLGAGQSGLWAFSLVAYAIGPSLFAGLAAAQVAGLRTTRFAHSLYTTPVRKGEVLAAKVLVTATAGALYLLATLPFLLVASWHVAIPSYVGDFLAMGVGLLAFGTALGTLLGVLLTGRSAAGAIALGLGFMVLSIFAVPTAVSLQAKPGGGDESVLRVLHLSPHLLLSDGLGLMAGEGAGVVATPLRALALVALGVAGMLGLAAWAYLREQGVEGWESPAPRRAALVGLLAALLLLPALAAEVAYHDAGPEERDGPGRMAMGEMRNGTVAVVRPGAPAAHAPFSDFFGGTFADPLDAGRANARDLLVLLPAPEGSVLLDVRVTLRGEDGLGVAAPAERDLGRIDDAERGTAGEPGMRLVKGLVVRLPVSLTPSDPRDLSSNWYHLRVLVTYRVEGDETARTAEIVFPLRADVPGAGLQMALAGAPLFLLATTASVLRRVRVG